MKIRFLTLAAQEVDEAFVWFEGQVKGKGIDFLDDLDRTVRLVRAYPLASFEIEVIAVAHTHRAPRYWADRVV